MDANSRECGRPAPDQTRALGSRQFFENDPVNLDELGVRHPDLGRIRIFDAKLRRRRLLGGVGSLGLGGLGRLLAHGGTMRREGGGVNGVEGGKTQSLRYRVGVGVGFHTDAGHYWAVDFDYESLKEIIKVPRRMGVEGELPGVVKSEGEFIDFEERWTGAYIFENEWQSFRTRQSRDLELTSVSHVYPKPGRYTVAVKVIDIFGNDTMTLVPLTVG